MGNEDNKSEDPEKYMQRNFVALEVMLKGTALLRKQARLCSGQQVAALGSTTRGRWQGSYQLPTKEYAVGQAAITQ